MTRLAVWVTISTLFLSLWGLLVTRNFPILTLPPKYDEIIFYLPIYLLVAFGCHTLFTLGYRVASFNDCNEAADSLKKEIGRARKDLKAKGLRF